LKDLELSLRARTGTYLIEHPLVRHFHEYKLQKQEEMQAKLSAFMESKAETQAALMIAGINRSEKDI
jgi:hypothetical protein